MIAEESTLSEATTSDYCDNAKKSKLGICEVCAKQNAKYSCPRCEVKTCSLRCNKIHKLEVECNGERDRTKFIPVNKFTNLDLSSDYRLLEEISRVVDASKKGRASFEYRLNKKFFILHQETLRRNLSLKFLPRTFNRHKCNSTRFNKEMNLIEWHIDWIFVNVDNLKISEARVSEDSRISTVIDKYLGKQEDQELNEKLQFYQAAGLPGIKILLRAEQKSGRKFYELDPSNTFRECLKNKIIIEYPTIHLILKDQGSFYDIIDSDDDEDCKKELLKQAKSGQEVINKIIRKSESDDNLYKSLKNLLFISEYSEEEEEDNSDNES